MATTYPKWQNFLGGTLDSAHTNVTTTLTSAALAAMVAVVADDYMKVVLDPDGLDGEPEIVYVSAHTASATTATIVRGQEGTTGRAHRQDVPWVHAVTADDVVGILAEVYYNPAAETTYTNATSTPTAVDATNLSITFKAPRNGKVLYELEAAARNTLGVGDVVAWSLVDTGGTLIAGSKMRVVAGNGLIRSKYTFVESGLTAGTSYTRRWAHDNESNGTAELRVGITNGRGPGVMRVRAMNF